MSTEILIIDDNADIRNIINDLIIDAGYKTRLAANYNQALNEIDKKLPDVAIIDVKLDKGDNDGLELLSHIKTKDKNIPVIIITGHANVEMAIKALIAISTFACPVIIITGIFLSLVLMCDKSSRPSLSPLSSLTSIIATSGSFLSISFKA